MADPLHVQIDGHDTYIQVGSDGSVSIAVGWVTFTIPAEQWLEIVSYTEPWTPKPAPQQ